MKRAVALRKQGMSGTTIAKVLRKEGLAEVSRATVDRALAAEGVLSGRGRPRRRTPGQAEPDAPASPTRAVAATPGLAVPPPPDGADVEAWMLVADRLKETRELIARIHSDSNVPAYRDLVRLETELSTKLMAMTPAPTPDPEHDPANIVARDKVRARLEDLVSRFEEDARR